MKRLDNEALKPHKTMTKSALSNTLPANSKNRLRIIIVNNRHTNDGEVYMGVVLHGRSNRNPKSNSNWKTARLVKADEQSHDDKIAYYRFVAKEKLLQTGAILAAYKNEGKWVLPDYTYSKAPPPHCCPSYSLRREPKPLLFV